MLQNENPYEEEDLVDMSCGKHISPIGDTLLNEGSYLPSLRHVDVLMFEDTELLCIQGNVSVTFYHGNLRL